MSTKWNFAEKELFQEFRGEFFKFSPFYFDDTKLVYNKKASLVKVYSIILVSR